MMRVVPIVLLAGLLLAGCGQKGPLFLPGEAPESQTQGPFGLDADQTSDQNTSEDAGPGDDGDADSPAGSGPNDNP